MASRKIRIIKRAELENMEKERETLNADEIKKPSNSIVENVKSWISESRSKKISENRKTIKQLFPTTA